MPDPTTQVEVDHLTEMASINSCPEGDRTGHTEHDHSDACVGAQGVLTQLTPLSLQRRQEEAAYWSSEGDGGALSPLHSQLF